MVWRTLRRFRDLLTSPRSTRTNKRTAVVKAANQVKRTMIRIREAETADADTATIDKLYAELAGNVRRYDQARARLAARHPDDPHAANGYGFESWVWADAPLVPRAEERA